MNPNSVSRQAVVELDACVKRESSEVVHISTQFNKYGLDSVGQSRRLINMASTSMLSKLKGFGNQTQRVKNMRKLTPNEIPYFQMGK